MVDPQSGRPVLSLPVVEGRHFRVSRIAGVPGRLELVLAVVQDVEQRGCVGEVEIPENVDAVDGFLAVFGVLGQDVVDGLEDDT